MRSRVRLTAERDYLARVAGRLRSALGRALAGVYAGGSYALGDYMPGRSDLDVAAVVTSSLSPGLGEAIVERLCHAALPCPARKLELVIYRLDTARSGSASPDFDLNLNTGGGVGLSMQSNGDAGEAGSHWFAIDRSVLSQAGVALLGPPAGEVFAPIAPPDLVPTLIESLRWHRDHGCDAGDAVLNACRSLRFAEQGRWSSKPAAGRWAAERRLAPSELVARAIAARAGEGARDHAEARRFLTEVEIRLRPGRA